MKEREGGGYQNEEEEEKWKEKGEGKRECLEKIQLVEVKKIY